MAFRGFPPEAVTFYEGLEADNTKAYWTAHKAVFEQAVKLPMAALCDEVPPGFRPMKAFRPNRDVRFSTDKSPYKTAHGALGESDGGSLLYVQVSAHGFMAAVGQYAMAADQLARFRSAVDDDRSGAEVAALVADLVRRGCSMGAVDELKTAPRGYPKDHPRVALLQRKGLMASRSWPPGPWLSTRRVVTRVNDLCRDGEALMVWLDAHVGPSELAPDERDLR